MSFTAQIDQFIASSKDLAEAVIKDAAQAMSTSANTPTSDGGLMRVDTGFLRNSIAAEIGTMPSGESINPRTAQVGWQPTAIMASINSLKLGDVLYIGWTANYAEYREAQDAFMRSAAMNWPFFVNNSVAKLKQGMK